MILTDLKTDFPFSERISADVGRFVLKDGSYLGKSDNSKDCYWGIHKYDGRFFISLNEDYDCMWEVSEELANYYNENPVKTP